MGVGRPYNADSALELLWEFRESNDNRPVDRVLLVRVSGFDSPITLISQWLTLSLVLRL